MAVLKLHMEILDWMIEWGDVSDKVEALYRIADLNSVELDSLIDFDWGLINNELGNIILRLKGDKFTSIDKDWLDIAELDSPEKIKDFLVSQVMAADVWKELSMVESHEEEKQGLVRRFATQLKQAIQDFESKYEKRIRSLRVVSNLTNVNTYLASFRKNLVKWNKNQT